MELHPQTLRQLDCTAHALLTCPVRHGCPCRPSASCRGSQGPWLLLATSRLHAPLDRNDRDECPVVRWSLVAVKSEGEPRGRCWVLSSSSLLGACRPDRSRKRLRAAVGVVPFAQMPGAELRLGARGRVVAPHRRRTSARASANSGYPLPVRSKQARARRENPSHSTLCTYSQARTRAEERTRRAVIHRPGRMRERAARRATANEICMSPKR